MAPSVNIRRILACAFAWALVGALLAASTASATTRPEPKGPARVLVLGDSVFNAFNHVESAAQLMNDRQSTIFATQGCQRLVNEGCMDFAKLSALQQLRRHAGKFTDVVVVGTGYNDRIGPDFKEAVVAITDEARIQGVDVLWVTYRVAGNVRGKSRVLNEQLARFDKKIDNLYVADWDAFSRDTDGWFREDNVHLITRGAIGLAQLLNKSLAPILAARDAAATAP
ncbi:MAG: hypothetical protein EBT17_04160 [Actinobacteria bacterium]|nr:hypothetical protein [Actinomycetota bacterium]NBR76464.1 hypothetical protein [Actinomycetota bacterium]NBR92594.1 hypothetical protein [Actinomycetota bacterium]NBT21298.1 hypothetical protein [Actinomycetota bacterium]NDG76626.1 hypothetical protein [Acidimicrobiia bacterium]